MSLFDWLRRAVNRAYRRPRAHPRVMISEPVRLQTPYSAEQPAILEDISVGGGCIRTHVRLRPGDTVGLLMSLGVSLVFDTRARVVYSLRDSTGYEARYGVRFVGLGARDATSISNFVVEQKFGRQFGVRSLNSSIEREQPKP